MDGEPQDPEATKRTDVGYKRPPVEHQFKLGQKPPPRKPRPDRPLHGAQLLRKILAEERRLKRGAKVFWRTNASLVVEVAFRLAEEGNSAVRRALADYLLVEDELQKCDDQPLVEVDVNGPSGVYFYTRRVRIDDR
jgi:hypothetical protein